VSSKVTEVIKQIWHNNQIIYVVLILLSSIEIISKNFRSNIKHLEPIYIQPKNSVTVCSCSIDHKCLNGSPIHWKYLHFTYNPFIGFVTLTDTVHVYLFFFVCVEMLSPALTVFFWCSHETNPFTHNGQELTSWRISDIRLRKIFILTWHFYVNAKYRIMNVFDNKYLSLCMVD
jgi:hypothetical protein